MTPLLNFPTAEIKNRNNMGHQPKENPMIHPTTQNLLQEMAFNEWPRIAAIVDFGIDSGEHYKALREAIANDQISTNQLEWALGNGPRLTKLVNACYEEGHPHHEIVFKTSYDGTLPKENDLNPPPLEDPADENEE